MVAARSSNFAEQFASPTTTDTCIPLEYYYDRRKINEHHRSDRSAEYTDRSVAADASAVDLLRRKIESGWNLFG